MQAGALYPRRPRAHCLLAVGLWLLLGGCQPAERASDLDLARAENALLEERHDWARVYLARDVERHPDHLDSLRRLGLAWSSGYQQSLSEAAATFERYLEHQPDDQEILLRLIDTQQLIGQWEQARPWLDHLDDSAAANLARARLLAEIEPEAARPAIERALATDPAQPGVQALAAEIFARDGDSGAALGLAEAAVASNPFDYQSWYLLARLRRAQGDSEGARQALDVQSKVRRLQEDGTMGSVSDSEKLALLDQIEPSVAAAGRYRFERRRAELLFATGETHAAVALAQRLLSEPQADLTDRLRFAKWAEEAGRRALARDLFDDILAKNPDHRGALSSVVILRLHSGELASARNLVEQGLRRHPNYARLHFLRGRIELAEGHQPAALAAYHRAIELAPWESGWRLALAELLRRQGELAAVRQLLDEAPEANPRIEAFRERWLK